MTNKEYLMQIQILDARIEDQKEYIAKLRESLVSSSMGSDAERVASSHNDDKFATVITKIIEEEKKLDDMIYDDTIFKVDIINQIHQMSDTLLKKILMMRYVEYKVYPTLRDIANALGYSEKYIKELHLKALEKFLPYRA